MPSIDRWGYVERELDTKESEGIDIAGGRRVTSAHWHRSPGGDWS